MAVGPVNALLDTFSRSVTDGWGTMDSGQAWLSSSGRFDVDGTYGTMTISANLSYTTNYVNLSAYDIPDQDSSEVLMLTRYSGSMLYPLTDYGPILSRTASNTFYYASIQGTYSECTVGVYVNGTPVELNRGSFGLAKNQWYWMRFRRDGSGLKLRIWKKDTAEPGSWTLTSNLYDGSNPPGKGDMGVWCRGLSDAYTVDIAAYYGYTREDVEPAVPVTDTFERNVTTGFGWTDSGHAWNGSFAYDPAVTSLAHVGSVIDAANGAATFSHPDDNAYMGTAGPSITGNAEILTSFSFNTAVTNSWFDFVLCGSWDTSGGPARWAGYSCRVTAGGTTISLKRRSTLGGSTTNIATSGAITALVANQIYWVRFQKSGTTIQARIWLDGAGEPGTWNVTVTDATLSSGLGIIAMEQSVAATKIFKVYSYDFHVPVPATTLHTVTGTTTSTAITDTTLALRASFTNDTDADNSIVVEYKQADAATWTTFGGTKTRVGSPLSYTFTLTGLLPLTTYNTRVTFSDPDDVTGTNPRTANFTTTATGTIAGVASLTTIGTTTATVEITYTNDTDSDSTATSDYRIVSQEIIKAQDEFTDTQFTLLQSHVPDVGTAWTKHTSSDTSNLTIYNNLLYFPATALNHKAIYYTTIAPTTAEYTLQMDLTFDGTSGVFGLAARIDTATDTMYVGRYNSSTGKWEIVKVSAGTITTLASVDAPITLWSSRQLKFVVYDAYKALFVDGLEVCRTTDNTISAIGKVGLRFLSQEIPIDSYNTIKADSFKVTERTIGGSFTGSAAMTADRPNHKFTRNITGLTADTVYEFRMTLADADGLTGASPQSVTGMTTGQAVKLLAVAASPQQTAATLDITYDFDTNNNSSVTIQYRNLMNYLWTTVPSNHVTVNRGSKVFTASLLGLQPNATYAYKVVIDDVNGLIDGSLSTIESSFTTLGIVDDIDYVDKHYLWKVFSPTNEYICTWTDAGEPEFAWHENGGVSDLTVDLPRRVNTLGASRAGIAFQNRIDIWCVAPSSDGMGVNLVVDDDFSLGSWTLGTNASVSTTEGPDGLSTLKLAASATQYVTRGTPILLREVESVIDGSLDAEPVPMVLKAIAKASVSKLLLFYEAYDINDNKIAESDVAETVGPDWQQLRLEYLPPKGTHYIRVAFKNDASGTMYASHVELHAKELLLYRGRIESFTPKIDEGGESIQVEVLGLISLLSDDYIDFLQFVTIQPQKDATLGRENLGPMDPSEMLRRTITLARQQNPNFSLYYTADSIHNTGTLMEYTFRNQQLRNMFDKIRNLCPPDWHYYIEPDGKVNLRGPEHATTHLLRRGVEILSISIEESIRNLKNYITVRGRQDEDTSEPDGFGTILFIAFDPESIATYGKRALHIQDANITSPDTAEFVANGRLDEYNREEKRATARIPDEKSIISAEQSLRGYNIESFRPGDQVTILDPIGGLLLTYWDALIWDESRWNFDTTFVPLPESVPIKTIQFSGSFASLELSERQPSGVGDFGRLYRWLQTKDSEDSGDT